MLNISEDIDLLRCSECLGELSVNEAETELQCVRCNYVFPIIKNIPYFCDLKEDIIPRKHNIDVTNKSTWTRWRRLNFNFCKMALENVGEESLILDIAAGPGHFQNLFKKYKKYIALDIYPYPDISIIADFTKKIPIRNNVANVILLSNVLEHSLEPYFLLKECYRLLKTKEGILILIVPFWIKIHQAPLDFYRYTSYALEHLIKKSGFLDYKIYPLGDIFDVYEIIQKSILKTCARKMHGIQNKVELKIIAKINMLIKKRLKRFLQFTKEEKEYAQGYACIAIK